MDLINLARGPLLKAALVIFFAGVLWRLVSIVLLARQRDRNEPRRSRSAALLGGFVAMGSRSWPHPEFIGRTGAGEALGYSYHIGLFILVLLFAPHIAFFGSFFGVRWPSLPSSVITVISVLTFTLLLAVLFRRVTNRVLRRLSNFDDYFSWFVVTLVMVTGLAATAHIGGPYQTLFGLHVLSFDLLLIWYPFGKLMHAFYIFPTRGIDGYLLTRKGAPS
jgi:nitrate reductase gamma subunit